LFSVSLLFLFHNLFWPHVAIFRCSSHDRTHCTVMPFSQSVIVFGQCKKGIIVLQVPSRDEHVKMAAWGRNMLWKREWTNRKQRCILADVRKSKQLFSECNRVLKYNILASVLGDGAVIVHSKNIYYVHVCAHICNTTFHIQHSTKRNTPHHTTPTQFISVHKWTPHSCMHMGDVIF
jgi:hypothetical protein